MLRKIGPGRFDWALLGAWMGVIFYWSHQVKPGVPGEEVDLIRKFMHVGEYLLLYWLWCRALAALQLRDVERVAGVALLLTIGYSIGDEFHQLLVGRDGSLRDVLIDNVLPALIWLSLAVRRTRVPRAHLLRQEDSELRN